MKDSASRDTPRQVHAGPSPVNPAAVRSGIRASLTPGDPGQHPYPNGAVESVVNAPIRENAESTVREWVTAAATVRGSFAVNHAKV